MRRHAVPMLVIGFAAFACSRSGGDHATSADLSLRTIAYQERLDSRTLGNGDVIVYELFDFQCPFCRRFALETFPAIRDEYLTTGRLRWVILNNPRPQHRNAVRAAEALMCAAQLGRFWEASTRVLAEQDRWAGLDAPDSILFPLAAGNGLGASALTRCVRAGDGRREIAADSVLLAMMGVHNEGVPTFISGGRVVARGALPIGRLRFILDSILAVRSRDVR